MCRRPYPDRYGLSLADTDAFHVLWGDIGLDVAELVHPPGLPRYDAILGLGQREQKRDDLFSGDLGPELVYGCLSGGDEGRRRREDIAAMKRLARRGDDRLGILDRHDLVGTSNHRHRRGEQAVVRPYEGTPGGLGSDRLPVGAHTRIDDSDTDAFGQVLDGTRQRQRRCLHVAAWKAMADVDDA